MDIEYGADIINKYRDIYTKYNKKIKFIAVAFVVATIAIVLRKSFTSIDQSIENDTVMSIDETPPELITLSKKFFENARESNTKYRRFVRKKNTINQLIQRRNIANVRQEIDAILNAEDWHCVHLRHYDVPFDIVMFKNNLTMIDPNIVMISEEFQTKQEVGVDNIRRFVKRPVMITVDYVDEKLYSVHNRTLTGNDAICFSYYKDIEF